MTDNQERAQALAVSLGRAHGIEASIARQSPRKMLNQVRALGIQEAERIIDGAEAASRGLTSNEQARLTELAADRARIDQAVEGLDFDRDYAARSRGGRATPLTGSYLDGGRAAFTGPRFGEMFPSAAQDSRGWESFGAFVHAAANRLADPRLMASSDGANSAVPSDGGFLVPTQFYAELLDASLESEIVRPRARVVPMLSDSMEAPVWDKADHSGGAPFGFSIRWMAQTVAGSAQKPKLATIRLHASKCAIFVPSSNELMQDGGLSWEDQLTSAMRVAMAWALDDVFLNGTGTGQPLGIYNSPTLITVAPEVGQVANTITFANITEMAARHRNYSQATWVCSQTAMPQLLTMSIPIGTGGTHIPVLTKTAGQFEILQRPVVFTEKLKPVGSLGDILLADFDAYIVGLRQDADLAKSEHALFDEDQSYFRIVSRVDGQPIDVSATTPKNGATLSPFVTLAARA